jgi:hypothetical protein
MPAASLLELSSAGAAAAEPPRGHDAAPARKNRGVWFIGGAVAVGLAAAGAAYPLWRAPAPAPPPRFLLIEKQADAVVPEGSSEPAQPSHRVEAATSATAASAPSALPAPVDKVVRAPDAPASGSTITAAFQRQRGRIEGCFRAHSTEEQPQLTIRFQVEANGVVRSADLQPASLGGTALGSCILGIARATRFPAAEAPMVFSIPITARKAAR